MKRYAPLLTLLAVAVLGVALLTITSVSNPANRNTAGEAAASQAQEPAANGQDAAGGEDATGGQVEDGPAAEPVVDEKAYVGRTADRKLTVAIAVKEGRAVAYVCDGKQVEAWLEGTLEGDKLELKGNDATLTGTVSDAKTDGTFTRNGKEYEFSAKGVNAPAGLYEGRATGGVTARIGWIVDENGGQTGVINRNGQTDEAPRLDTGDLDNVTIDGAPVIVQNLNGNSEVVS